MKNLRLLLIVLLGFTTLEGEAAESLVLSGIYQGKDLYVKNPFSGDGVGFCVFEVYVNGDLTRDEINSSAFAIDFNVLGIEVGSPVEIILNHKANCEPLVLNPESIKPHSTFTIQQIGVKGNVLSWSSQSESGSLPYIVEQYRWNKWVKSGEVEGKGSAGTHQYSFELSPYSGENKVRVKQLDYTLKPRYSESVTYTPSISKVAFEPKRVDSEIVFTGQTRYEIFDKYGNLVKTGYGKTVDVGTLAGGDDYYINYDSSFGETFRKK